MFGYIFEQMANGGDLLVSVFLTTYSAAICHRTQQFIISILIIHVVTVTLYAYIIIIY